MVTFNKELDKKKLIYIVNDSLLNDIAFCNELKDSHKLE